MTARVQGLGHIGLYVRDLDVMAAFYRDFLGMTVTKQHDNGVFLSADPATADHEVALLRGRPSSEDPHLVQQISMRVDTLSDLRDFHRRIIDAGMEITSLVSHVSAVGCYFNDPEGNPTEIFWVTGFPSWVIIALPIDIERPDAEILADIRAQWDQVGHVRVGDRPDADTQVTIARLTTCAKAAATR